MTLFIHSVNVHQGGGKSLLSALLGSSCLVGNQQVVALLDSRMTTAGTLSGNLIVKFVPPAILDRIRAEWWLARNVQSEDVVLCFGSLPPLFKLRGHTTVFIQNRYLIEKTSVGEFPLRTRLRLMLERVWFSLRSSLSDEFIVQTPSMKACLLTSGFAANKPIHVMPFVGVPQNYSRKCVSNNSVKSEHEYDFIYVAAGDPHKNHRRLIEAWSLLAADGVFPSLCLTVNKNEAGICDWISQQKELHGLHLDNYGVVSHEQVKSLYRKASALIYPSLFESFGLPLIEARQAGLPILAPENDYVRDLVDPEQSFDPTSPKSIARAVKRHMGMDEGPLPLLDADEYLLHLLKMQK